MSIGRRIVQARQAAGWSQEKLSRAVGAAQTTVSSWERGRTEPSRDDVARIAAALGVGLEVLELGGRTVPLVGFVGAGAEAHYYADGQGPFDQAPAPDDSTRRTVAVEVKGTSLGPLFDGWLIYYDDVRSPVTPDLIGRLCVVGLPDGRILVKRLRPAKTPGLFHLESNIEPTMLDQEVAWAARVKSMSPR